MKSLLILLLLSGGLATSAAAQAGWGTSDAWDAPKKKTVKKTPAPARQSQAVTQDKAMQNNGVAAEAPAPVAAPAPASSGFGASGGASSAPMGMGMSAAPGTPVMMQSGRNVLRDDAIAARERRRLHWAGKSAAAVVVPAPVEVAPAPAAAAAVTTGAGNAAGGQQTAPPATKPVRSTKSPKKAAPAPSGW